MAHNIHKGDFIKYLDNVYIDYPGGAWFEHFVTKIVIYRVKTEPTNNGNFLGDNIKTAIRHFNLLDKNIIEVIKRG